MSSKDSNRVVERTDNLPPEVLPLTLATAADIPTIVKADVDRVTTDAVLELDTYSRVPEVIESQAVYDRVVTLSTQIKTVSDAIDARRSAHKRPYLDAGNAIDAAFKLTQPAKDGKKARVLSTEIAAAHKSLKGRLSAYDTKIHREEQARLAEEAAKIAEAAAADGIDMGDAPVTAAAVSSSRSEHGGAAIKRLVKVWSVIDADQIPRNLLMPDPDKIKALVDGGAKSIPGILIEEVVDTHTQRR